MRYIFVAVATLFVAHAAYAQQMFEYLKLNLDNSYDDARFGKEVAVDGTLTVVGATRSDEGFGNSGAVYLYDTETGAALGMLVPDDAHHNMYFGDAIALTQDRIIVGAPGENSAGLWTGAVYIFDRSSGDQLLKVAAGMPDRGSKYGSALSVSGDYLAIGAPYERVEGVQEGVVYVVDLVSGAQLYRLEGGEVGDQGAGFSDVSLRLGWSVAVDEQAGLVFGGAGGSNEQGVDTGKIFAWDLANGELRSEIVSANPTDYALFGWELSYANGLLLVGAPFLNVGGVSNVGRAEIFDLSNPQQPVSLALIDIPFYTGDFDEFFGRRVQLIDDFALIGAPGANMSQQAHEDTVFLFDIRDPSQPEYLLQYLASDGRGNDQFAEAIHAQGNHLVVGAWKDSDDGVTKGGAYLFELPDRSCAPDFNLDGSLNFFDVSVFLVAYQAEDPIADFSNDGVWNFFDVSAFLVAFQAGCP